MTQRRAGDPRPLFIGLSLAIAVLAWFYVATAESLPVERRMTLALRVRGPSAAEVVTEAPARIRVDLKGPRLALAGLTPAALGATVDLAGLAPGEHDVPVNIRTPPGVRVVARVPADAWVVLDRLVKRRLAVQVTLTGAPPPGVVLGSARTQPGDVLVSGATSAVDDVRRATVTLDTSRLQRSLAERVPVRLLDAAGREIPGLTIDPPTVDAILPARAAVIAKVVPVVPRLAGRPASGLAVTGVTSAPATVAITGIEQVLRPVETAPTVTLDIRGARSDVTRRVALELPKGSAASIKRVTVMVRVGQAPVARIFPRVPVRVSDVPKGLTARSTPARAEIEVRGPLTAVERLVRAQISVTVNAAALGRGLHRVKPRVALPRGVRVVMISPARITVRVTASSRSTTARPRLRTVRSGTNTFPRAIARRSGLRAYAA